MQKRPDQKQKAETEIFSGISENEKEKKSQRYQIKKSREMQLQVEMKEEASQRDLIEIRNVCKKCRQFDDAEYGRCGENKPAVFGMREEKTCFVVASSPSVSIMCHPLQI